MTNTHCETIDEFNVAHAHFRAVELCAIRDGNALPCATEDAPHVAVYDDDDMCMYCGTAKRK